DEPGGIGALARRVLRSAPTAVTPFTPLLRVLGVGEEEEPDVARAAGQGLTFGFSDELVGAARGALGPGTVGEGIQAGRAERAEGALGGGVAGAVLAPAVAGGVKLGGAIGRRLIDVLGLRPRTRGNIPIPDIPEPAAAPAAAGEIAEAAEEAGGPLARALA